MGLDTLTKIVSGGQTGADQAALDFAIAHGISHGGWCPKGRVCESGTIPEKYRLQEMPTDSYSARTERNVLDSDGTVIISVSPILVGGSLFTLEMAQAHRKPVLHLHRGTSNAGKLLAAFIEEHRIGTLNVAGPRASTEPMISELVEFILEDCLRQLRS